MQIDREEQAEERAELHFLAATVEELMKAQLFSGVMTREQLQEVENAVGARVGSKPRTW